MKQKRLKSGQKDGAQNFASILDHALKQCASIIEHSNANSYFSILMGC